MLRRTLAAAGGLLVLFHAWLLGSQIWDGQLAEPGLLLRWLVAAGLVMALAGLRRSGASILWGRKAISIWLLAAVLHGPAMASDGSRHESPALPEAVTALVQIAAAAAALGLGLVLIIAFVRRSRPRRFAIVRRAIFRHTGALEPGRATRFAPRPPPILAV